MALAAVVLLAVPSTGMAHGSLVDRTEFEERVHKREALAKRLERIRKYRAKFHKFHGAYRGKFRGPGKGFGVPELDGNASGAGLTLAVGGFLILAGRRRRPRSV